MATNEPVTVTSPTGVTFRCTPLQWERLYKHRDGFELAGSGGKRRRRTAPKKNTPTEPEPADTEE